MHIHEHTHVVHVCAHLVVVLRRRHGDVEHARRNTHAVGGHRGIAIGTNETQRVVREMVILKEAWN
jgi:hypothetical protein